MAFRHKAKKKSLQFTIPENLDNDTLRETYMNLIYMESRKRQDRLSKLGAWGPWESVEKREEVEKRTKKTVELNKN